MLLILDSIQTDPARTAPVRAAAKQFVKRYVGVNDLVAVVHTGASGASGQDFTSSQPRLLAAIDKFVGHKPRRGEQISPLEKEANARTSLNSLRSSAEFLGNIRGRRKAVIWFGEGIDANIENVTGAPSSAGMSAAMEDRSPETRQNVLDVLAAANRAGVRFYGVDARGVGAGLDEAIDIRSIDLGFQAEGGMQQVQEETRRSQSFLRTISTETGGFAVINQNDLNAAFTRIIQENSSYYLLGYYPTNDKRDGRFHKVDVRVKRPGLQVKARAGYTAPKGKPAGRETPAAASGASPELRNALDSPLPTSGLGLRVFAAPFSGPSKKSSLAIIVEVDPTQLKFQPAGNAFSENVEIIILPVNASGKALDGARDEAPLRLSQAGYDKIRTSGFRVTRRLDLAPGRYQLHIAAQSTNGKAIGALTYDIDVPDFSKSPLMMSGMALMSASAGAMVTAAPDKAFSEVLPVAATAMRDFPPGDTLNLFTEVYDNQLASPHTVDIKTTVTADDGKVLFSTSDTRKSEEIGGKAGGYGHTQKIPLADYKPGRYVLRVEATSSLAGGQSAARELEFRVR